MSIPDVKKFQGGNSQFYQADWTTLSESILPSFSLCVWPGGPVNSLNMNWVLSLPDWSKTMPRIIQ